ncbi:MAG: TonB-dependent receptor [Ignavibacteriae bacterium]|nr:TonB-dependent receptor [Ignavibacteriota bacterium]
MKTRSLLLAVSVLTCCMGQGVLLAQSNCVLSGRILDATDNSALVGALVILKGTTIGTVTDIEGRYTLASLPAGRSTIFFRYLGYGSDSTTVDLRPGVTGRADASLAPEALQGQEVVVTAQLRGQRAAINQQLTSSRIVNVVSKDRIQELPDNNAAESISRLPGISIERDAGEGSKVVIRGLAPAYNAITVNGQKIPATDPQNRSVDLSMISSDILAGIEVVKALTPDQDADAVGGTVNFALKKADEGFSSDVRVLGGYNKLNNDWANFRGSVTVSDRFLDTRLGVIASGNWQRANRGSDNLSADYGVVGTLASGEPDLRISSLSLVDKVETRYRYGGNLVLDYQIPDGEILFNTMYSRTERDEVRRRKGYSLGSSPIVRYVLRSGDINTDLFTNSLSGKHQIDQLKVSWQFSSLISRQNTPFSHESEFRELAAYVNQTGIRSIDDAIAQARNDTANTIFYTDTYGSQVIRDRDLTAQIDLTLPFTACDLITGEIKFGGKYRDKERSLDGDFRYIEGKDFEPIMQSDSGRTWRPGSVLYLYPNIGNFKDNGFTIDNFLEGRYLVGPAGPLSREQLDGFRDRYQSLYKPDYETDLKDYNAGERIAAGYVMTTINLGPRIMFLPGVRYERTSTHYVSKHSSVLSYDENGDEIASPGVDTIGTRVESEFLPMIHLRYRAADWADVRLAFTRTLSRPNYLDLAPWERETSDGLERGEPFLNNTRVRNYDLIVSMYSDYGLLTLAGFYKSLDGITYIRKSRATSILGAGQVDYYHPENSPYETNVYGMEVEVQSNLSMLPEPFDGLLVNFNYSLMRSKTYFPYQIIRTFKRPPNPQTFIQYVDSTRESRMPGQADQLVNATLGYEKKGLSVRVSMTYQGDALQFVGATPQQDGYSKSFLRWDVSMQYKFMPGLALLANINNISSLPEGSYLGTIGSPIREEYFGWTMDLGIRIDL